jgi:hypothetical protein
MSAVAGKTDRVDAVFRDGDVSYTTVVLSVDERMGCHTYTATFTSTFYNANNDSDVTLFYRTKEEIDQKGS